MTTPFSIQELQLVRGSLSSKTDEEIAQILERPIEDIIEVIDDITHGQATERQLEVVRGREEATRKRIRQKPKKVAQPKKQDAPNVAADREAERQAERKKLAERAAAKEKEKRKAANIEEAKRVMRNRELQARAYKTKTRDWSQYRSVRVDKHTHIMVHKDEDSKEAIKRYKANLPKDSMHQKIRNTNS